MQFVKVKKTIDFSPYFNSTENFIIFENEETNIVIEFDQNYHWLSTVNEGDFVEAGQALATIREFKFYSKITPAAGIIEKILRDGYGRLQTIYIKTSNKKPVNIHTNNPYDMLSEAGLLNFIKERPFNQFADPVEKRPLFINAMNSAPNQASVKDLTKKCLAEIMVAYNCLKDALPKVHFFCNSGEGKFWENLGIDNIVEISGGHPAGNSSIHLAIHKVNALEEKVWTLRAVHLSVMGEFLLRGTFPSHRWVKVSGDDVVNGFYNLPIGCSANALKKLCGKANTMVFGDLLTGVEANALAIDCAEIQFVKHSEKSLPLCPWISPRISFYSRFINPLFTVIKPFLKVDFSAQRHGAKRAMVFNNIYNKVMPLNIKIDFLIIALLKGDLSQAMQLGLADIVPEDVALCEFMCPSKLPLQKMVYDVQQKIILGETDEII